MKSINIEIVSGGAKGADTLAERYAKESGFKFKLFPAEWNNFGNRAGPIRNVKMAQYADACICFWDGESKGTKHMIEEAKRRNLILEVVNYKDWQ